MHSFVLSLLAFSGVAVASPRKADAATLVTRQTVQEAYDYVIVGGGTAGLTVADRLTADGKTTVLVVEVGQLSNSASITTVRGGVGGMTDPSLQYSITSAPQTKLGGRSTPVMIGKVVGGSSAVNAMMTIRGTSEDYDRWGGFFSSNSSWSWNGLLPYFRRALNFVPPNADVAKSANITYDTSFWGNTSGVYAAWPSFQYPASTVLLEAFRGLPGVEFAGDSGAGKTGLYWYPTFMDPKSVTRSYARTGHYDGLNRANYQLVTGSKVNKILFDGTTATGVTFVPATGNAQTVTTVKARKEVIIAAGAIHSPQVLQLSGIGPKSLLDKAKIETVVDLPGVGQNFQDHTILSASFSFRTLNLKPSQDDMYSNRTFSNWATTLWNTNKTGPYSLATGNAAAWLSFPVISSRAASIAASLTSQNHSAYLPADTHPTVSAGYTAQMKALASALLSNGTAFYNLVMSGGSSSGMLIDLHPLSRGTVNIDTSNPTREPLVDYRVLTNPLDPLIMADILRYTRKYHLDNPLTKSYGATEFAPGREVTTDEQFAEYLVESINPSYFHPVGTCAMMPRELGGVVDEELRVYGTKGLRVVDASVMSTIVGANTCQTTYAVAEKAADLIKGVLSAE
ncbi:putative GMC oxidoreductase [Podospora aff. communis PSN243]|uniref:GMC oxidoreductase n=1 Tax=Podospora aff. communis PSN243 TaxID=3040156 RepID=A0AAV9GGJ4_9PEZI|nr:putative GMC oxidoreductase [Podospora aff. communis PSN243]